MSLRSLLFLVTTFGCALALPSPTDVFTAANHSIRNPVIDTIVANHPSTSGERTNRERGNTSKNTSENPTHYGPPSVVGGQCKSDERDYGSHCQPNLFCKEDSDCPTDVPPTATGTPRCHPGISPPAPWNEWPFCYLPAGPNGECPLGAYAFNDVFCFYSREKDCYYIESVSGSWVSISSSSGDQSVTYQEGITRSHTVSDSSTWGASVTVTASAGFDFFGAETSISVAGTVSNSVSHAYSSTFSMSSTTTHSYQFKAGVVWQWKFAVKAGCGTSTASGHDLALTTNLINPPCCLPGMFADPTNPTGACAPGTPSMCKPASVIV